MKSVFIRSAVLTCASVLLSVSVAQATSADNLSAVAKGIAYLNTQQAADGHINGFTGVTPWAAIAYSSNNVDLDTVKLTGGTSLRAYLAANPPTATAPATEWEKDILAITADSQNPYNFGGVNYVAGLKNLVSGGQIGSSSTVNDDVFGVLALIASREPNTSPALTGALAFIIAHQHADGGFSSGAAATDTSDVDDTAAAIMALKAAQSAGLSSASITSALSKAKAYILAMKNSDGGYPYDTNYGALSDVSSTSWVVMAFTALGEPISPNSLAAQAYIRGTQQPDGSFPYQLPLFDPAGTGDTFNSAYAIPALAGAAWPLRIYSGLIPEVAQDQTPSPTSSASPSPSASPTPTPAAGSALGATTTPPPTPSPAATAAGSVLGASTLPAVGEVSNAILLLAAFLIATAGGLAVLLRQHFKS